MTLREKYHVACGVSRHDAVDRPLIEMTGYIKWLEDENQSLNRRYEVLSDYTISQQLIRDRLYAAVERLKTDRDELEKKYQNDPATIQLLECTDRCIELEKQRDELQLANGGRYDC